MSGLEESDAVGEAGSVAVALRLLPPDGEERADDAVLTAHADAGRRPARGKPVEDRLHLVGGGMPGRAQAVRGEGVAKLPKLGFGLGLPRGMDDLRAQDFAAEARVLLGLLAPQLVVHVQGRDVVAQCPERVPEAGRVGAAGDEAVDGAAGRDQVVPADVLFDPRAERSGVHGAIVGAPARGRNGHV